MRENWKIVWIDFPRHFARLIVASFLAVNLSFWLYLWGSNAVACLSRQDSIWYECFNFNETSSFAGALAFGLFVAFVGYCLSPLLFFVYLPLTFRMWRKGKRVLLPYLLTAVVLALCNAMVVLFVFNGKGQSASFWLCMYGMSGFFTGLFLWMFINSKKDKEILQYQLADDSAIKRPEDKNP